MYSDYQNQTPIVINDRSSEGLADANIRIGNMLSEMSELQIKLQAMYLVMLDQGIDPQVFEDKIEEVMKTRGNKNPVSLDSKVRKDGQEICFNSASRQMPLLRKQRILLTYIPERGKRGRRTSGTKRILTCPFSNN